MGVVVLAALFQALGQAPESEPEAGRRALDSALEQCVEQAAVAALGRPLDDKEQEVLSGKILPEARTFVDRFRIVDEGAGGGTHFVYVEADVALGRLVRGLAPAAPTVHSNLSREHGAPIEVRGTGQVAVAVRVFGEVLVGEQHVGVLDEKVWGFGSSEADALGAAELRADQAARVEAHALAASSEVAAAAKLWVSVQGLTRPAQAIALHEALSSRVPGVRAARLLRAGGGRADLVLETGTSAVDVAAFLEEMHLDGFSLTAEAMPGGGEVQAHVLAQ